MPGAPINTQNPQQQNPLQGGQPQVQPNQGQPPQMRMLGASGVIGQPVAIVQPQPPVLAPNQQGQLNVNYSRNKQNYFKTHYRITKYQDSF